MPNIKNISNCNGCGACYSICPTTAIAMKPDIDGFLMPMINQKYCVSCGKCDLVCTAQNRKHEHEFAVVNATSAASRYNNLLSMLHLENRMFADYEDFLSKKTLYLRLIMKKYMIFLTKKF